MTLSAPECMQWMYRKGAVEPLLAVSDRHSSVVHIYQADDLSAGKRAGSAASAGGGDEGAATALAGAAADDSDAIVIGSVGSGGRAWGSGGSSSSSASTSSATVAGSAAAGPSAAAGASAGTIGTPAKYTVALHSAPVLAMAYNALANAVVSCDGKGMIEYWSADPDARFEPPRAAADKAAAATSGAAAIASGEVAFGFKYETDLYALAKAKTFPVSLAVSPGGDRFVVASTDRRVRVFGYVTGKLEREYSEAVEEYEAQHKAGEWWRLRQCGWAVVCGCVRARATSQPRQHRVPTLPLACCRHAGSGGAGLRPPHCTREGADGRNHCADQGVHRAAANRHIRCSGCCWGRTTGPWRLPVAALQCHLRRVGPFCAVPDHDGCQGRQHGHQQGARAFCRCCARSCLRPACTLTAGRQYCCCPILPVPLQVCVHLGLVENTERFLSISLFQGVPKASSQYNVAKTGSAVPVMSETKVESAYALTRHHWPPRLCTAAF